MTIILDGSTGIVSDSTASNPAMTAKGNGSDVEGYIQLNCRVNSHGVKLKSPPHSSGQSYTMVLPDNQVAADKFLKVKSITGSGATAVGQLEYADVAGGGKVLDYKSVTKTDTFTTTTNSSFVTITGLSVTITPAANSKILVMGSVQYSNSTAGSRNHIRLYRDSSAIAIGDSRSNRSRSTFTSETNGGGGETRTGTVFHLDTHGANGSTSVTYTFRAAALDGGTLQINKSVSDSDSSSYATIPSFLTILELAP
tara:strand:+ start:307 stop:1068 length:762 start_codon:yes stop_codon:yes gene_type:complete